MPSASESWLQLSPDEEQPPPLTGSISFIYASAETWEAQLAFYGEILQLGTAGSMGDGVRIFALPGAYLGVVRQGVSAAASPPLGARDAGKDTVIVGLLCESAEDVDEYYRRLANAEDVTLESLPAENKAFGIYNFLVRDPAGYLVELQVRTKLNKYPAHLSLPLLLPTLRAAADPDDLLLLAKAFLDPTFLSAPAGLTSSAAAGVSAAGGGAAAAIVDPRGGNPRARL